MNHRFFLNLGRFRSDLFNNFRFDYRGRCWRFGLRGFLNMSLDDGFDPWRFRFADLNDMCFDDRIIRFDNFDDVIIVAWWGTGCHPQLLAKLVCQAVFNCIGMRCHRHAHMLQFPNDLGIVAIEFAG